MSERQTTRRRAWGQVMGWMGLLGVPFFGLTALLAANPCGALGDACEDYGQTGDGFGMAVLLLWGSVVTCLVGFALASGGDAEPDA